MCGRLDSYSPDVGTLIYFQNWRNRSEKSVFPEINILNKEVTGRTVSSAKMMFYVAFKGARNGGNYVLSSRVIISKDCYVAFSLT